MDFQELRCRNCIVSNSVWNSTGRNSHYVAIPSTFKLHSEMTPNTPFRMQVDDMKLSDRSDDSEREAMVEQIRGALAQGSAALGDARGKAAQAAES
jgi:hypothetical protein